MALGKDEEKHGEKRGESSIYGDISWGTTWEILWDIFWDFGENEYYRKNTSLADGLNILTTRRSKTKNRQ